MSVGVHPHLLECDELATTDVILMEVLAGARDDRHRDRLQGLVARCEFIATEGPRDYEDAAQIYRICRGEGAAVRSLTDCLIAAVALRVGVRLIHRDTDLATIANHTRLALA